MRFSPVFLIEEVRDFDTTMSILWLLMVTVSVIIEVGNPIRIASFRTPYS
jgi:hypothetical protein